MANAGNAENVGGVVDVENVTKDKNVVDNCWQLMVLSARPCCCCVAVALVVVVVDDDDDWLDCTASPFDTGFGLRTNMDTANIGNSHLVNSLTENDYESDTD